MTARRIFFKKLAVVFAGMPGLSSCSSSENDNEKITGSDPEALNEGLRRLLVSFVDTIVPEDEDPGAVAAGIPDILIKWISATPQRLDLAKKMLERIDLSAHAHYREPFTALDLARREKVLRKTEMSGYPDDRTARDQIRRLRSRVITEFYLSPTGRAMLGYTAPFPGGYPDYDQPPPA